MPGRQEQLPEARHLRRPHRETQSPRSRRRSPRIPQACNLQLCSSSSSQIDILETYLEILNIEIHGGAHRHSRTRSEEHTSELQSLMRISYAVFCLKKKIHTKSNHI